jgi:hypothetical protein
MAKVWRKESIEEMEHADRITDRIIFLDGFPNMQGLIPCGSARTSRKSSIAISPPKGLRGCSIRKRRALSAQSRPGRCS